MKKFNKITPEGTKDILFEECLSQRTVSERLTHIFKMRGYNEVITPGMEYYDVFDAPNAAIPQYEMYKSTDNKGRLIVFRPDLTLPIARLTATRLQAMEKPIRLYYNQPIYRNRKDLSGRSNETTQAGIELLGASGLKADIEVIAAAVEALSACTENFRLEIGSAKFFGALADELPVSADKKEDIRQTIESKNYAALGDMLDALPKIRVYRSHQKAAAPVRRGRGLRGSGAVLQRPPRAFRNARLYAHAIYRAVVARPR